MNRKIKKASVERPGDVGMDLPPGITARELGPTDYHPVDMELPDEPKHAVRNTVRRIKTTAKKVASRKANGRKANGRAARAAH